MPGARVGDGKDWAPVTVGVYDTTDGRFVAADRETGSTDPAPIGAMTQAQNDAIYTALAWNIDPGLVSQHPLTVNSYTGADTYPITKIPRRTDLAGTARTRYRDGGSAGDPGNLYRGPFDLIIMMVTEPNPTDDGRVHFAYTEPRTDGSKTWEMRLNKMLGNPIAPPPYNTIRFLQETVWHELGHFVLGMIQENHENIGRLISIVGGPWNTGAWEGRALEGGAESFKDMFFSDRQYNNRTYRKLRGKRRRDFGNLYIADALVPKGTARWMMGETATDLVEGYTAPVNGWPIPPRPHWGSDGDAPQGPDDYDYPAVWSFGSGLLRFGWSWGGRGSGFAGGVPILPTYRKPPAPGSKVKFKMEWFEPVAPIPTGNQHCVQDPQIQGTDKAGVSVGLLDPGIYPMALGGPLHIDRFGGESHGPGPTTPEPGIVWLTGRSNQNYYDDVSFPTEIASGPTYDNVDAYGDPVHMYVPAYFDFNGPGLWEFEFTVPDHGGELTLQFSWGVPWFSTQGGIGGTIEGFYPIRTHPQGFFPGSSGNLWTMAVPPSNLPPDTSFPQGNVQIGAAERGRVKTQHIVVGKLSDAIPLIDPTATDLQIDVNKPGRQGSRG